MVDRTTASGTGAFHNGAATGSAFADFDLAYDAINSYEQGSKGGTYTVQAGDTLAGIASALWGDSSLWYKLAEINGLTAESTLIEGQPLLIPVGVVRNTNNAGNNAGDTHSKHKCTETLTGGGALSVCPLARLLTLAWPEQTVYKALGRSIIAMPRLSRIVAPGAPHHVTQRGNRRQQTFFGEGDYIRYLQLAAEWCAKAEVECWGYCLMPNHVHLILTPKHEDGLRAALSPLHQRYTRAINLRERWTGYLWQGRFASYPMDEDYFVQASRYVGLNPVRAGLVKRAQDWPWSSVRAHLSERDDTLVRAQPLQLRVRTDMPRFFETDVGAEAAKKLRRAAATGRPLGGAAWLKALDRGHRHTLIRTAGSNLAASSP